MSTPPNIVYLHSHDTGKMISPYGAPTRTPSLQRLAEQGVVFRQAFAAAPTCSPSRAALLTGQSPHQAGMLGLAHRGHKLTDPDRHLAWVLGRHGYDTALAGLQHLAVTEEAIHAMGYQRIIGSAPRAHLAAREYLQEPRSRPFFLDVGFFETHRHSDRGGRFSATPEEVDGRYTAVPAEVADTASIRQDAADFSRSVTTLDTKIGTVLDAVRMSGQAENTLVIVTTDHGIPFPHHKCTASDRGLGVMLILAGAIGGAGSVVDQLVSHLDVFPTICELAGIPRPAWLQGASLIPLLNHDELPVRDEVFGESTFHGQNYVPVRTVRTQRYRYVRRFQRGYGEEHRLLTSVDEGLTRQFYASTPGLDSLLPEEELVDCLLDPSERHNLVGSNDHESVLTGLRARLERWMTETDDPLCSEDPVQT